MTIKTGVFSHFSIFFLPNHCQLILIGVLSKQIIFCVQNCTQEEAGVCYFPDSWDTWVKRQTQMPSCVLLKKKKKRKPKQTKTPTKQNPPVTSYFFRKCIRHLWYISNISMLLPVSTTIQLNLVTVWARPIMKNKITRKQNRIHTFVFELCGEEIRGKSSETASLLEWGAHTCSFEVPNVVPQIPTVDSTWSRIRHTSFSSRLRLHSYRVIAIFWNLIHWQFNITTKK